MGDYSYTYGYPMYDPYASMPETPTPLPNPAGVTQAPMQMPQVPNVMTGLNSFVDGLFGGSRNAAGSFDPNKVSVPGAAVGKGAGPGNAQPSNPNAWMDKYGFDPEMRKMMEFQQELAQRQADVYRRNKPDTSNFNLGNVFTGLGAVAYMTSKNPQVWSHSQAALGRMQDGNESRAKAGRAYDAKLADIEASAIGSGGDMAVKMMMKQREKRDAALDAAAEMVKRAEPENRATALELAASDLESKGYHAEARQFRERARSALGSRGEAQPQQPNPSAGNMVLGSEPALEGMRGTQKVSPPADPGGVSPPAQMSPQPMRQPGQSGSIYGEYEPKIRALMSRRNVLEIQGRDTKAIDNEIKAMIDVATEGPKKFAEHSNKMLAEDAAKRVRGAETAQKAGQFFDMLDEYSRVPGVDYYIGPLDASPVAPYTTDLLAGLVPGNEANPALRDQIKGTQMALVSLLKERIRTPGEGSQDQREFQALIDTIGDFSNARNVTEFRQKLADAERRVSTLLGGIEIPRTSTGDGGGAAGERNAPQRTSTAKESPVGTERVNPQTGKTMVKVGPNQWVEKAEKEMPGVIAP